MFTKKNNQLVKNFFMNLARKQAHYALGNTGTNPAVGCVLVKNGCIISAAYTGYNGRPHAEFKAIKNINGKTKGSYLYVTLEPCSHYGKTPPCVKLISKAGINKVFFSVKDIDPRSHDKSSNYFKTQNINVEKNVFYKEINSFYRSYYKFKKKELPFVTCKLAISKDMFSKNIKEKWITNRFSRGRVHLLRSMHDCLITSYKTIKDDNPRLNCRINGLSRRSPRLIILDKNLKISLKSKVFNEKNNSNIIIFYNKSDKVKFKRFKDLKIKLVKLNLNSSNKFNLRDVLRNIRNFGYSRIIVESGKNLLFEFLLYWSVGAFYSFITPEFTTGTNGYLYYDYYISHGGILFSILYCRFILGYKSRNRSWFKIFLYSQPILLLVHIINYLIGGN